MCFVFSFSCECILFSDELNESTISLYQFAAVDQSISYDTFESNA